ncbi:glycosyltransferase family 4 protein [Kineococcus sp. TBRC 1896]|uniref:Glycosyltransferase family 4 protein n=1 Tax=Kineococcus mangrovi TaxID=1660183 RepID=A0ABV4I061_9ACTN
MRILTQSTSLDPLGGVELCTLQWTQALGARGHSLSVAYTADGAQRVDFTAAGARLHGPARFGFDPRTAPRDLWRMGPSVRWAAGQDPDVVWVQRFEHSVWGHAVAAASRRPLVVHLHQEPESRHVRLLGRGVSTFLATSEHTRRRWTAAGLPPERVRTVRNAVPEREYPVGTDADRRAARAALGLPPHAFTALHYGRLWRPKGTGVVLEAWRRLGLGAEGHLLLVGQVDDPQVAAEIAQGQQEGWCTWLPNRPDVVTLLHACDVVLFPTLLPEAFGRVALEALLTARPVLASAVGAVPEVLAGTPAGRLLPPGDVDALVDALRATATSPEPARRAVEAAGWARREFSYERHLDELEDALQHAASAGRGGVRASRGVPGRPARSARGPAPVAG